MPLCSKVQGIHREVPLQKGESPRQQRSSENPAASPSAARWNESPPINTAPAPAPQACSWFSPGLHRLPFCRPFRGWLIIKMPGALDSAEQTALSSAEQLNSHHCQSLSVTPTRFVHGRGQGRQHCRFAGGLANQTHPSTSSWSPVPALWGSGLMPIMKENREEI